ncbi:neuroglian isoform X2 [Photinus pyralis]|uniref:Neuroglian n=1 Tax=Photinus pyralis TaxID=7054 RepID=A0A1Y1MY53_PHOPY|nr:neuroglian isoform X2 [Photinus pyralis]
MLIQVITFLLAILPIFYAREIPSPPRIVKQPPTDEVLFQVGSGDDENDKPFYIECEAIGEPAPKYRWIKNGKNFDWQTYDDRISQQSGRGTLSITKPANDDIGQYQCFAENEWGVATSNSVFMRRAELNSFKNTPPLPVTGNEGEPFKLTCQPPDGWPKPKVYWMIQYTADGFKSINNSRMTLDPEGNLWFSNLTREDASDNFMYACAASSATKLVYKLGNRVLLNVLASGISPSSNKHTPVLQYVTRKNEVALRGKSVELFCIFGGTPLPQTVWSKNGKHIQSSDRITQGNYGKSLVIKLVDFDDEGAYTCEVSNGVGEAKSYSINLEVLAVPYFTEEPEFITAADDETVEFRCAASGVPEPQIKWIHNGKPIAEAPPNPRRRVGPNSIIIERVSKKDTGNYGCNATNSLGYIYKDVYINVLALAPEISEATKELEAVDGKDVNMTCKVYGAPKPEVKWIHNGKALTGGRYKVLDSGDLHISNVQFEDSGDYLCYAENKFGKANATCKFIVRGHTEIRDGPEDYEVKSKLPATFRCNPKHDNNLKLEIIWLRNGQQIDSDAQPRFVKSSDFSLTITQTRELDSGNYTCVARTRLDQAEASAILIVQEVPNQPQMKGIICNAKDATINWMPMGDNRAPILRYIIKYNTSFTPNKWDEMNSKIPPGDMSYNVPMSPWANYTFQVIAVNKIGQSKPSDHSGVCTTSAELPHRNPDNVEGKGDRPDNLIISWTPMPQIEHNAPRFHYKVYWKEDIREKEFQTRDIMDWQQDHTVIENTPPFTQYRVKVLAMNEMGASNVAAKEVIGYSGEDQPTMAPDKFSLIKVQSPTAALLSWNPVPLSSVRGHFRGYKIKTWTENRFGHREIQVQGDATKALVNNFVPFSKNYAQVYVYNDKYNGPPSETLSFDMPEGVPGPISSLQAYQLGSSAFYLEWKKPEQPNGILRGYNIYYETVEETAVGKLTPRHEQITDPDQLRAKLGGLHPSVKYRLYVSALTNAGESSKYFIERETKPIGTTWPSVPDFTCQRIPTNDNSASIKVTWLPNFKGKPGSYFFVKYKKKGDSDYISTSPEENNDYLMVQGLQQDQTYEFILVAADGTNYTPSQPQEIDTYGTGPIIQHHENVATAGWFIGMMLAIAFLLLVLILVCIVKRNRGGKYAVHEREQANGRRDYPDEGGFHEYSQPLDNKSHGRASMSSEPKVGPESDTDSMAEYGEGDTEGMNEDGSFIGQYGRKTKPGETTSQGFATLV